MGLLNIGRSEGAQIIQMFGRGVRLRGLDMSLTPARGHRRVVRPGVGRTAAHPLRPPPLPAVADRTGCGLCRGHQDEPAATERERTTVGAALAGHPCWPTNYHRGSSPPGQRHTVARTGGEQAPPLRRFAPTPPDNDRLFPARPRPVPRGRNEYDNPNRRGGPCWPPVLANAPPSGCRLPANATRSRGRAGSKPRPYGASRQRRRTTTDCSLHVRVPSPGVEMNTILQTVGAALAGRPCSPTHHHRVVTSRPTPHDHEDGRGTSPAPTALRATLPDATDCSMRGRCGWAGGEPGT